MFAIAVSFGVLLVLASGSPISTNLAPFQVSLENFRGLHVCAGALIKPDVIITAAHCIDGVKQLTIRAGSKVLGFGGQVVEMKKNCPVTGYDFTKKDNDIAVLRLKSPVTLNENVQLVPLPKSGNLADGAVGSVTGWGYSVQRDLRKVSVEKVGSAECKKIYGNEAITPNMVCMKYNGAVDACSDDVKGNPLIIDNQIVGVTSVPGTCDPTGSPGVYAKINPEKIQSDIDACI